MVPFTREPYVDKDPAISPDGKWKVKFENNNAVLLNLADKSERQLTKDGTAKRFYVGSYWSPDSKKYLMRRCEAGQRRFVSMIEAAPEDQVQPKVHKHRYDKPGDKIDRYFPVVAYIDGSENMEVKADVLENHFSLERLDWLNNDEFIFHCIERGFGKYHVVIANADSRTSKVIIAEESDTYVNRGNTEWHYLNKHSSSREIIWLSERDGYNHLYLYDGVTGKVKNQITTGDL